jgi:hypothetical protein
VSVVDSHGAGLAVVHNDVGTLDPRGESPSGFAVDGTVKLDLRTAGLRVLPAGGNLFDDGLADLRQLGIEPIEDRLNRIDAVEFLGALLQGLQEFRDRFLGVGDGPLTSCWEQGRPRAGR